MYPVTISDQPERLVTGCAHRDPYDQISTAYATLGATLGAQGLWPQVHDMVAVYFDDPDILPPAEWRSLAGVVLAPGVPVPDGLETQVLPGGRHAVVEFNGPYAGLHDAYRWLYGDWLRASGETPREAPAFEVYLNSPMDTAPEDLRTDIYLPLA